MDRSDFTDAELSRRLQILAAEQSSLIAARALAWSESFSRATMFLAVLSASVVAIALVAQASAFGNAFALFALVLLPMVFFLGVTTYFRLGAANYHDGICVLGMNRIRHAYLEIAPDLEAHFTLSPYDDFAGITTSMALPPAMPEYQKFLSATPNLIVVINSIVGGVIVGIGVARFTPGLLTVGLAGVIGFLVILGLHVRSAFRTMSQQLASYETRFPTPESG